MIIHKKICRILAKKGGTITLSLNDQHSIGAFSVGKEGSALGASFRSEAIRGRKLPHNMEKGVFAVGEPPPLAPEARS